MGVPSVVKIKKGNVEYTSKVDIANYTMRQLTRRALQDVSRYIMWHVRSQVRGIHTRKPGAKGLSGRFLLKKYSSWVMPRENILHLGMENKKHGGVTAWFTDQSELGTNGQPKRGILYNTVLANVSKIVEIEAQYLPYMENEAAAMAAIRDVPEEGFGDE